MTKLEIDATLTQLKGYFPKLGTRLDESPQLLQDAISALYPYEQDHVLTACRRLAFTTLLHQTLETILEVADAVREEQKQARAAQRRRDRPPQPVAKTLDELMEEWVATPHDPVDLFWAQQHQAIVQRGLAHDARALQACYEWMAQQCPALRAACERQIELLQH